VNVSQHSCITEHCAQRVRQPDGVAQPLYTGHQSLEHSSKKCWTVSGTPHVSHSPVSWRFMTRRTALTKHFPNLKRCATVSTARDPNRSISLRLTRGSKIRKEAPVVSPSQISCHFSRTRSTAGISSTSSSPISSSTIDHSSALALALLYEP
jgi:hypothetical protein